MHLRRLGPFAMGLLMLIGTPLAHAAPAYACVQVGEIHAMPPIIPAPIHIHECTSFEGGPGAVESGKAWCDSASKMTLGPKDVPPVVTPVGACPAGALARCRAALPGGADLTVDRYYYRADAGAGGLEGLRKTCEAHKPGQAGGVFTKF